MSTIQKGTSTGADYKRELNTLLKQQNEVNRLIMKLQTRMIKDFASKGSAQPKGSNTSRKVYVERKDNDLILVEAIKECLKSGNKMKTKQICEALKQKGLFNSESGYFYTMVNNKLNVLSKDPSSQIQKAKRGVYYIQKATKKSKKEHTAAA